MMDQYFFHTAEETSFFMFSLVAVKIPPTFGCSENSQKVTWNLPGIFISEKETFGSSFLNGPSENFKTMFFG